MFQGNRVGRAFSTNRPSSLSRTKKVVYAALGSAVSGYAFYKATEERSFSREEISRHKFPNRDIWVTYRDGVYDISPFVALHPGGDVFDNVAGGSIDRDWEVLSFHETGQAQEMLEKMRIGKIGKTPSEKAEYLLTHTRLFLDRVGLGVLAGAVPSLDSPNESHVGPERVNNLNVHNKAPYNADPNLEDLAKSYRTAQGDLYIRNHYPIPQLNADTYQLHIMAAGKVIALSPKHLATNYKQVTVEVVQACAGNRRGTFNQETSGTPWRAAVGNVCYRGPRLLDVLNSIAEAQGFDAKDLEEMHLYITGMDHSPSGTHYNTSIAYSSIPKDALLALSMNGEVLTPDHGYPLRVVIPGYSGHYWMKFPEKMMLISRHCIDTVKEYADSLPKEAADLSLSKAQRSYLKFDEEGKILGFAGKLPVQSQILQVLSKKNGLHVKGYGSGQGGIGLARVEVSVDGGKTWREAEMEEHKTKADAHWGWTFWHLTIPTKDLPEGCVEVLSRATDSCKNTQPKEPVFNKRGLAANGYGKYAYPG